MLSQGDEEQTYTSLQTTANEQELAFPMLTAQPEARQALEHDEGLVQPTKVMAAANRTACLAFCANAYAENAQWGGGVWPGEGLYDLRESVWEGELPRFQPSERAAG